MTTPGERLSPEIRALVEDLIGHVAVEAATLMGAVVPINGLKAATGVEAKANLLAALGALENKKQDWQPIETAPKDGTRILLYWPYWNAFPFDAWCHCGQWIAGCVLGSDGPGPTHWMKLPEAPHDD